MSKISRQERIQRSRRVNPTGGQRPSGLETDPRVRRSANAESTGDLRNGPGITRTNDGETTVDHDESLQMDATQRLQVYELYRSVAYCRGVSANGSGGGAFDVPIAWTADLMGSSKIKVDNTEITLKGGYPYIVNCNAHIYASNFHFLRVRLDSVNVFETANTTSDGYHTFHYLVDLRTTAADKVLTISRVKTSASGTYGFNNITMLIEQVRA